MRTGRPRSTEADAAIHEAALALLAEGGFEALTMEALAQRAAVSKPTLYRRYHSPAEVALGLVAQLDAQAVPVFDSGDLRADLLGVARGLVRLLRRSPFGGFVASLVGAQAAHPELAAATREYVEHRRVVVQQVIERGVERGELPPGTDAHYVLDLLLAPFYFRHLISNDPLDDAFAGRVVDSVLGAAGAPAVQSPKQSKETHS
jgi:AcrR family transcriptional regulator